MFKGKNWKLIGAITAGVGLTGTIAFGVLLGVGANATYQMDGKEVGIGSLSWDNAKSYNEIVKEARKPENESDNFYKAIRKANDEMISGAVLTTIFSISAIFGAVVFVMNRHSTI